MASLPEPCLIFDDAYLCSGPAPSQIGDANCDLVDLVVLRRYLAGKTPGIAQVCSAVQ